MQFDAMEAAALFGLTFLWFLFAGIFFLGRRGAAPKAKVVARSNLSRLGIVTQLSGYLIAYTFERPYFTTIVPMSKAVEAIVLLLASVIGVSSIIFCYMAMRTLGKQWSLVAQVVADHELVQQGPFAVVRNPIYLAMFGLLVQASIVVSNWRAALVAVVVFLIGTHIRIREEEKVLRQEFGAQFDDYARRVPAFFPQIF